VWSKLEQQGLLVLECLEQHGYEAYFVGGYVRDKLWGKPVKDIDIATSALPEEVVRLFERTIPTGLKHGTVTVLMGGITFEVTTYRKESDYADFRRPAEVEFISDLHEDLQRRDFTMNAMAMDRTGAIRDPFNGRLDMDKGLLRCVGAPEERFQEDALRMLRCVRFASTYALEIDPETWRALQLRRELLRHVAMERVRVELERTLSGPYPLRGWRLVLDSGLLGLTKEPLHWKYSSMEAKEMPSGLSALDKLEDHLHRWMLLVLEAGLEHEEVRSLLRIMTFSVKDTERIAKAVELHYWAKAWSWSPVLREEWESVQSCSAEELWQLGALRYGTEAAGDWLAVMQAVEAAGEKVPESLALLLQEGPQWLASMRLADMKELALSGKDLLDASGRAAGPWVGRTMTALLRLAAIGRIENTREALLAAAASME
jgi:tRNA nucleotidyltransferase (CCA-adding enzyme)